MAAIFSPDIIQPRYYKAAEQISQRFNVSKEEILNTMTEHCLIYFAEFSNSKNSVTFEINPSRTNKADEITLNAQDGFILSGWGRGVRRVTKGTDSEYTSNEPILFSNQPVYFNGVLSSVTEYDSLMSYFMGKLNLSEKNGDPIINDYSGLLTYNEPLGNYTPAASAAVPEEFPEFSINTSLRNLYPQQILLGSSNYKATVQFSNGAYSNIMGQMASDGSTARTTQNIAVLVMRGFVVPGLASAKLLADR